LLIQEFDELQVRMKAFLAKIKCYNKCVKIANTEAAAKQKNSKKERLRPIASPQASSGTLQETPLLVRSVAAVSLTVVGSKQANHHSSFEQSACSPIATTNRSLSKLKNSPDLAKDFSPSTTTKGTALPDSRQRESGQLLPTTECLAKDDLLSQWNTDSEFLVTGNQHGIHSVRNQPASHNETKWVCGTKHSPLTSPLQNKLGNVTVESVKHSTPDRKSVYDTLRLVRSKLHPPEAYRKKPAMEQPSSTESDITPSLFDTTQDDVLTCSSLTSFEQGQERSVTTDSVEYDTSTQECSTSGGEYATSERNTTIDPDTALDYSAPDINPISILTSFKNYFKGGGLPSLTELSSEQSGTFRDQDTLVESLPSHRSLECGQSRSTVTEFNTKYSTSSEKNSIIGPENCPGKSNSSPVLHAKFRLSDVSDARKHRASQEYVTFKRNSGPQDYPMQSNDMCVMNSSSVAETVSSNTVVDDREYVESTTERDYSTIASTDYPMKTGKEFEEYAVSDIASTYDDSNNWQGQMDALDSCGEQVKLPPTPPNRTSSMSTSLLDTRQQGGYIECSPRARRRSRTATVSSCDQSQLDSSTEQHLSSNNSSKQLPEDNIPNRSSEMTGRYCSTEYRDGNFEPSAYETYVIGPTFGIRDNSAEQYSASKKCTRKSSMKRTFSQKGLEEENGTLRERSASVKSVRFNTYSLSVLHRDEKELTRDDGHQDQSSCSTGYLQSSLGNVTPTTTECSPLEVSSPVVHHNLEPHSIMDCSREEPDTLECYTFEGCSLVDHAKPTTTREQTTECVEYGEKSKYSEPECPKVKRKRPSKHKPSQLPKDKLHSDTEVKIKTLEHEHCPDLKSDGRMKRRNSKFGSVPKEYSRNAVGSERDAICATERDSTSSSRTRSAEKLRTDDTAARNECAPSISQGNKESEEQLAPESTYATSMTESSNFSQVAGEQEEEQICEVCLIHKSA
jgi:hypothetical protein